MRFKNCEMLEKSGYLALMGEHDYDDGYRLYRIDVVVFTTEIDDDGTECLVDGEYWEDGFECHRFECFFDDLDEARTYAGYFTADMAMWAHTHGNGPKFDHVAVCISECSADMVPWGGYCSTYDWMWGRKLEEWHDEDCGTHKVA